MTFECFKYHTKCKAACCGVVPIEKEIYERNRDKLVNPVEKEFPMDDTHICPVTADMMCPFLNKNLTCNIYHDQPSVCKKYGDETHVCLKCPMQDKNGRERSRQDSRKVVRDQEKMALKILR